MSNIRERVGVLATLFILLFGSFMPSAAAAASANPEGAFNLAVSPSSKELEVKPGGSVSEILQVKNQGLTTEHIKISVMKFQSDNSTGLPVLLKPGPSDDFINWASFSTNSFDAAPNVWTSVKMTISPPTTAAFGYYYAIVFSREGAQTQSNVTNLMGSVASLVLLDVQAPGEIRQTKIAQFSSSRNVYEFLPATFSVKMQNTGNVHVAPRGNIFITKGGKTIGLLEVNLAEGNILPKSTRIFTAQWTNGTPSYQKKTSNGQYVVNSKDQTETYLDWSNFSMSKLRFGKYHAKLVMVYNNGESDIATQANLSFWVIPWRIIAGTIVVLVLIGGGIWALLIKPLRRRLAHARGGNVRRFR